MSSLFQGPEAGSLARSVKVPSGDREEGGTEEGGRERGEEEVLSILLA